MEAREVTVLEVKEVLKEAGAVFLEMRDLTNHPADWYLKVVRAYNMDKQEYIVWLYNATNYGLYEGYYTKDSRIAEQKYYHKN